ncbi:MAG TPA: AbrB/MazE/SpoVT family DNA-binding domain-containing protein [Burkholderiaceae bacterium]
MKAATLSNRGQIVIPKTLRELRHWCAGTTFVVEEVPQGILLEPVSTFMPSRLEDVMGCAAYRGPALSQSQIDGALHADVARPCVSKCR